MSQLGSEGPNEFIISDISQLIPATPDGVFVVQLRFEDALPASQDRGVEVGAFRFLGEIEIGFFDGAEHQGEIVGGLGGGKRELAAAGDELVIFLLQGAQLGFEFCGFLRAGEGLERGELLRLFTRIED